MELNNSNLSKILNRQNISPGKSDQVIKAALNKNMETKNQLLANLKPGDIVEGEITDIIHSKLELLMDNGEKLQAQMNLLEHGEFNIGQRTSFEVISADPSQITLSPLLSQATDQVNPTIEKALQAANLSLTDRNQVLVQSLIKHNMPINKDNLHNILKQTLPFKDVPMESLVTMIKNNIPLSPENVEQYMAYSKGDHQIVKDLLVVKEGVLDLVESSENPQFHKDILEFISSREGSQESLLLEEAKGENLQSESLDPKKVLAENIASAKTGPEESMENLVENLKNILHKDGQGHVDEPRADLLSLSKELLFVEEISLEDKALLLNNALAKMNDSEIKELIEHPAYKKFIKDVLNDKWGLKPKDLPKDGQVSKFYDNLNKDLASLKSIIEENSPGKEILLGQADKIQNNMDFMNNLNQLFHYIQLPLILKDKNAHGDLYVFKKDGSSKEDDQVFRLLLHLEMPALGTTNVHISVDGQTVNAQFFIEEKSSRKLIEKNISLLEDGLLNLGYIFNASVKESYEPIDFDNDIMAPNLASKVGRYSFDIRA